MKLIRSNRTEILADALASTVRENPLSPFAAEVIVVQSRGMERWLSLALAERLGIWSNPCFPFPRALIEDVLDDLDLGPSEQAKAYDPARLKWTIAQMLIESAPADLNRYLGSPPDRDRALRLASSIADVFDRYVVYRPELLKRWVESPGSDWQAHLWKQVATQLGPHDLSVRIEKAVSSLRSRSAQSRLRFERLHLFSLETLPPLFLRFFSELSKTLPTWLYLLEPSSEYVGEAGSSKQLWLPISDSPVDGHPFLSNVGRLSRDFQQLLLDVDESVRMHERDRFEDPGRSNLLTSFQADILAFKSLPEPDHRLCIDTSDDSISIHACTAPMREAQVLHDLIRGALESDVSLRPEDIVVMTPDLETYAPVFRAVFGSEESRRITYEVHDRKTREDASFYDDFLAVLDILDSRFSVLDLVRLMDAGSMRQAFRFNPEERARLTELLEAAGVRWGIDAEHRADLGFPAEALHTWREGLARLFLGFASTPQDMGVFAGLLPRGAPSLADAELIARLSRLCDILFDLHRRMRRPLEIDAWVVELGRMASFLFDEDGDESGPAARTLRGAFQDLRDLAKSGGYTEPISLEALRRELGILLQKRTPPVGFLRKGVTLTELVPLRSVPFRVVCLMGMSEEAFPRADDRPNFDQTRTRHRAGDRNKRYDDRHSFLQAVLCARDRLIVTYSAPTPSLRTDPNPSPVVWELREAINRYYRRPDEEPLLGPTIHPLHAFDRRYFIEGPLPQSFSQRYLQIARAMEAPISERPRLELRTEPEEAAASVSVRELTSWLWNAPGAFVDKVLGARFDASSLYEPTGALTELHPLDAARVGNGALRSGLLDEDLHAYLQAAPEFPDGSWGQLQRERLLREIEAFGTAFRCVRGDCEVRSARVATDLGKLVVDGRLDGLTPDRRTLQRFTKPGRKAEVDAWVEHLLMQSASETGLPRQTQLVLRGTSERPVIVELSAVAEPLPLLRELIELYQRSKVSPMPLLGESSRVFAESCLEKGRDAAIRNARARLDRQKEWDPRIRYALGQDDPFEDSDWAEAFESAALALYAPLLSHRSER